MRPGDTRRLDAFRHGIQNEVGLLPPKARWRVSVVQEISGDPNPSGTGPSNNDEPKSL
jgi:hypothetical protein